MDTPFSDRVEQKSKRFFGGGVGPFSLTPANEWHEQITPKGSIWYPVFLQPDGTKVCPVWLAQLHPPVTEGKPPAQEVQ